MLKKAILFALDPGPDLSAVAGAVRNCGLDAFFTTGKTELLELVNRFSPECLVVLSSSTSKDKTLLLAEEIRRHDHHCSILIFAASLSTEFVIQAMKVGVSDMLDALAAPPQVAQTVASLVARHRECKDLGSVDGAIRDCRILVGSGAAMNRLRREVARVAAADANVLITGESGTGKELVAQTIHLQSRRRGQPFVAVNCAAVPDALLESELFGYERGAFTGANASHEGKLQHAAGGTLFLDEIGEMSLLAQAKILRAVDNRVIQRLGSNLDTQVRVRLVAATNQNVEKLVQENKFRHDLYYRLNVVRLTLPPLRDRLEDIPELVDHMLHELSIQQYQRPRIIEGDMIRRLQEYDWPGNIRELRNVLESILVFSSSRSLGAGDVPAEMTRKLRAKAPYADERSKIVGALNSARWNRNEAAKILSCSRMTLYRKMSKYGMLTTNSELDHAS